MSGTVLHELQCGTCGVWHAIPKIMYDNCVEEGGFWHCPHGHSRGYKEGRRAREKAEEEIRRERDRLKQQIAFKDDEIKREREAREATERQLSASRGQVTKLRNRASAGVCPCCTRSFENLRRHMSTKHPGFKAEETA